MSFQKSNRNYAAEILQIIEDAKKEYSEMTKHHKIVDDEYNDLTHAFEFLKMNAAEMVVKAGEMKRNRTERRQCRESLELTESFMKWCDNKPHVLKELRDIAREVEGCKKKQANRIYVPRVRTELTQRFRKDTGR